jgi:putative membrane protein
MIGPILVVLVALIHGYFLVLEMFRWEAPRTRRIFGTTPEFAAESKVMAANQGLYNGFLAAGLLYGLVIGVAGGQMVIFLLLCVVAAGLYAALCGIKAALVAQTVPATLALIALFLNV